MRRRRRELRSANLCGLLLLAGAACSLLFPGCTEQPRWAGSLELPPADASRVLRTSGTGRMSLPPSEVSFDCVLSVLAPTPEAAWSQGSARVTKLTKALEKAGLAATDMAMRDIDLVQAPLPGDQQAAGYRLVQRLSVTLRNLARLPEVLTVALGAGADGIDRARFGITDTRMAGDRARERALQEARLKAEMLAQEVGLRLGAVQAVEEQVLSPESVAGTLDAPPGQFEVVTRIDVTWTLTD